MALTDSTPQTTDDDAQARRRRTPRSIAKNSRAVPFKLAAKEERLQLLDDARSALRGELPVIKIGRAWYVERAELAAWIPRCAERLAVCA
jgi:hypothetical protein